MSFADRLRAWDEPLVLYEVIPPHRSAPREEVADAATFLGHLLADHDVDAINIPEIRNESRNGNRLSGFLKKEDPRVFGKTLGDVFQGDTELVVNHSPVYAPPEVEVDWWDATFQDFQIPNIVVVGGESSDVDYPGPTVGEGAQLARKVGKRHGVDPCLGAITIPTRRRSDLDEPERMVKKISQGVEFFTSQVIYESHSTRDLLTDYRDACDDAGLQPAPVFLSFAPITGRKDAKFLEWLGVQIPESTREWILDPTSRPLDRSVRIAEYALREVLDHVDRHSLDVPVGINVEHIMRYNFEASEVLLERLTSLLELQEIERAVM